MRRYILLCLTLALLACGPTPTGDGPSPDSESPEDLVVEQRNPSPEDNDCTKVCPPRRGNNYRISNDCARCQLTNYGMNGQPFKLNGTAIQGFKIDHQELRQILDSLESDDEVYAMLSVKKIKKKEDARQMNRVADLVFIVQPGKEDPGMVEQTEYFDFTEPCPTACPDEDFIQRKDIQ